MEPSPNKQLAAMTTIPGMMEMVKFSLYSLFSFFFFLFSSFLFLSLVSLPVTRWVPNPGHEVP